MIIAIAVDDEPPALKVVENFCNEVDFIDLVKTFTKPHEAMKYLNKFPVDLLFLDIRMPSVSGIRFCKQISQDTMVIFTTAYSEYAVEGFNLNAVDYLLKPFTYDRFLQAVNKAHDFYKFYHQHESAQQYLFIRADYSLVKIMLEDILYVEGLDDYLKIYLIDRKPLVARMTMKAILEKLPAKDFIRVHRSFIVPVKRIERLRNKSLLIAGREIPVGSSYEEDFIRNMITIRGG
jgi:DNA-binding LytR/AlgR family response regulator